MEGARSGVGRRVAGLVRCGAQSRGACQVWGAESRGLSGVGRRVAGLVRCGAQSRGACPVWGAESRGLSGGGRRVAGLVRCGAQSRGACPVWGAESRGVGRRGARSGTLRGPEWTAGGSVRRSERLKRFRAILAADSRGGLGERDRPRPHPRRRLRGALRTDRAVVGRPQRPAAVGVRVRAADRRGPRRHRPAPARRRAGSGRPRRRAGDSPCRATSRPGVHTPPRSCSSRTPRSPTRCGPRCRCRDTAASRFAPMDGRTGVRTAARRLRRRRSSWTPSTAPSVPADLATRGVLRRRCPRPASGRLAGDEPHRPGAVRLGEALPGRARRDLRRSWR